MISVPHCKNHQVFYASCEECYVEVRRRQTEEKETVNHPQHYGGDTPYETIKVLEAWMTPEQISGFLVGNAIKYLSRADKKGKRLEDAKKAQWYINREVERLKGKKD